MEVLGFAKKNYTAYTLLDEKPTKNDFDKKPLKCICDDGSFV